MTAGVLLGLFVLAVFVGMCVAMMVDVIDEAAACAEEELLDRLWDDGERAG